MWAAHWLVAGYDGEHLVSLAGLHGDDPHDVRDALPGALQRSRQDRFFALWVLEATSGMRRCELAGARRDLLALDAETLQIEPTRVVVDGKVIESDGKTENAQHVLALDPFTLAVLKVHVDTLDSERKDFGPDYHDDRWLFCWENGKPPHPDTITRRFKRLAKQADLPEIDLHDVRHSYATADREVANTLADLIIGGPARDRCRRPRRRAQRRVRVTFASKSVSTRQERDRFPVREPASALGSGGRI